jgi:hypothetical protein
VLPGDLVFRYDEGEDYTSLPRGVGSFVAFHHSGDLLSIYCHLARGSLGPVRAGDTAADRIGIIGDTGHADGRHLHFVVFDEETSTFVNPLSFLPRVPDRQPPVIRQVLLALGDQTLALENGARAPPGAAKVLVEAYDLREDVRFHWPTAPYSLRLVLDGRELAKIVFDSLQVREGRMVLGGTGLTVEDLYSPGAMVQFGAVELRGGESRLLVEVRDFAGNEAAREINFTVKE